MGLGDNQSLNRQPFIEIDNTETDELAESQSIGTPHDPPTQKDSDQDHTPKKQAWPGEDGETTPQKEGIKQAGQKTGWFGRFKNWVRGGKKTSEMHLPDDKNPSIVYDEKKKAWVNTAETEEEEETPSGPPPKDADLMGMMPTAAPTPLMGSMVGASPRNKFSRRQTKGLQGKYVDVMKDSSKPLPSIPANLFSALPDSYSVPDNIFMPSVSEDLSSQPTSAYQQQQPADSHQQTQQQPQKQQQQQQHQQQQIQFYYSPSQYSAAEAAAAAEAAV